MQFFLDQSFSFLHQEIFPKGNNPSEKYKDYIQYWHKSFSRLYALQSGASDLYIHHSQLVLLTKWILEHNGLTPEFSSIKDMFGWVMNDNPLEEKLKLHYFNKSKIDLQQLTTFYPENISAQTRHSLGEIYTPLELASLVLQHALEFNSNHNWRFLDPACGSGTFMIALLSLLHRDISYSHTDLAKVLENLVGIDVNPLSIFVCNANLQIFCKGHALAPPPHFNIILADPLFDALPQTIEARFNCIIGNPPWYNLAAVQNRDYQERLKSHARQLGINPNNSANIPNIEVASLFLHHMAQAFLAPEGIIAFLLPRNIMKGSQNSRVRYFHNLTDIQIWDFGQSPFFPVEFIALFGKYAKDIVKTAPSDFNVQYRRVRTQKNDNNNAWDFAFKKEHTYAPIFIDLEKNNIGRLVSEEVIHLLPPLSGSVYLKKFHNGARLGPRSFLFVNKEEPDGECVSIRPDSEVISTSRGRWKYAPYTAARVHQRNLFRCVMSKFLCPFYVTSSKVLFLPTNATLNYDPSGLDPFSMTHFDMLSTEYLKVKKNGARQETLWDYISYNGKTTNPLQIRPLKVIYNAIGRKRVKAAVLKTPILVDDSLYYFTPETEAEAYYLAAILNSNLVSFAVVNIKDERNIHKNPWQLPIPLWQDAPLQQKIGLMGKTMEAKIQENLRNFPLGQTKKEIETQILRWIEQDLIHLDEMMQELFAKESA